MSSIALANETVGPSGRAGDGRWLAEQLEGRDDLHAVGIPRSHAAAEALTYARWPSACRSSAPSAANGTANIAMVDRLL
jgi:hypothetical protein